MRDRILEAADEPYRCCGGHFCCCETPEMPKIPCLCIEACLCPYNTIMVNRYMVRDLYQLRLDPCDEYLIWMACIVSWVICILSIIMDVPEGVKDIADCFIMSVAGCAHAQQMSEMDYRATLVHNKGQPVMAR